MQRSILLGLFLVLCLFTTQIKASDIQKTVDEFQKCVNDKCEWDQSLEEEVKIAEAYAKCMKENTKCIDLDKLLDEEDGELTFDSEFLSSCVDACNQYVDNRNQNYNDYITCTCKCGDADCSYGGVIGFVLAGFLGVLAVLL
ncbi:hypothetical protein PPERSA_02248 [Pseudocohnilembus persalinus]|uniref:Transmembrane protein n=1 Tax=Pseudocohnilembus persalinus TaxID=266149 RepID=A0A0V0QKP6_PSEPJ|nr:hypothetical protein PPERSA_02248 [Pseudocohnilembus persalinus]|eukprot:KRX02758.1 hypothetical protein PPERSA_02248 [Pseudocohnilembus persalinus]